MSLGGDFDVFATRSRVGLICEAIVALLAANAEIAEFFGADPLVIPAETPRIYRSTGLVPDRIAPFCVVRPVSKPRELQLNREAETILPVGIGVVYDEERDDLADGDQGLEELTDAIDRVLVADQRLEAGGGGALADGISSFDPVDLIPLRENEDGTIITLFVDRVVNYRYTELA